MLKGKYRRMFIMLRKINDKMEARSSDLESFAVVVDPVAHSFLYDIDLRKIDLISFHFSNAVHQCEILQKEFS